MDKFFKNKTHLRASSLSCKIFTGKGDVSGWVLCSLPGAELDGEREKISGGRGLRHGQPFLRLPSWPLPRPWPCGQVRPASRGR